MSPPDLLSISAIPRVKPFNIYPIINDLDPFLRDPIPTHHVLLHHIGDGDDRPEALGMIRGVFHPPAHPLLGAEDPPQEFYHPQDGILISSEASPKPRPMHPSVRLENIRFQCISHSEGNVVFPILDLFGRPDCKREESQAFWEWNRSNGMLMEPGILLAKFLCKDMDLIALTRQLDA